ncbi:MAG: hypothetical protein ACJ8BW_36055 [Ktedonobacteraceae bacterium]
MNPSTKFVTLLQTAKKKGQLLIIISMLTLLLLIGGGIGMFHPASSQTGVQIAATNGDLHVGPNGG